MMRFQEEFRKLGRHWKQSKGSFDSAIAAGKLGDRLAAVETPHFLHTDEEPEEKILFTIKIFHRRGHREHRVF